MSFNTKQAGKVVGMTTVIMKHIDKNGKVLHCDPWDKDTLETCSSNYSLHVVMFDMMIKGTVKFELEELPPFYGNYYANTI